MQRNQIFQIIRKQKAKITPIFNKANNFKNRFYTGKYGNHNFEFQHDMGGVTQIYNQNLEMNRNLEKDNDLQYYLKQKDEMAYWEFKADAIATLLSVKGFMKTDQLRCGVENLAGYNGMNYYERWCLSIIKILTENKVIQKSELESILNINSEVYSEQASRVQKFSVGDIVKVREETINIPFRKPHLRTPGYIYGVQGIITEVHGQFGNPELLAFQEWGPKQHLYSVRFRQKDLWSEYKGNENDTVEMHIFQHWLQGGDDATLHGLLSNFQPVQIQKEIEDPQVKHSHQHEHIHLDRQTVEKNAVIKEGEPDVGEQICEALIQLLLKKGIVSNAEIHNTVQKLENLGSQNEGARIVARAWSSPEFKKKLLENANKVVQEELGITASNAHVFSKLVVAENTETLHNVVVCTLCSCYPRAILGLSPSWYKSRAYRSRVVREPRKVLEEFGVFVPEEKTIRVLDSTADCRFMVLPQRPEGTEGMSEEELVKLVTRDSMIGVEILGDRSY